jgi:SAM-dependent methyltransferase
MDDPISEGTRRAWADIWQAADIERELHTRSYQRAREIRRTFLPFVPRGRMVLEAGCGLGAELVGLASEGFRAVGVDYVLDALQRLKRHRPSLQLAAADVHALPFPSGTFGAYLSFGVLEHFPAGPTPALIEAARVLSNDGILVVTVPAPNFVWRLAQIRHRLGVSKAAPYFETTYSASALTAFVTRAGFEVIGRWPTSHDFTLWGCGPLFRGAGYYETNRLAEVVGRAMARVLPQAMSFATLIVARKKPSR